MALSTHKSRLPRNACFLRPINFTFTNDPNTPSGELAQAVVLKPIAEALGVKSESRQAIAQAVLKQWRSKLTELRNLGWSHVQKTPNWFATLNCRPTSAYSSGESTLICRKPLCPWCYSRRIIRLLDLIGYGDQKQLAQKMHSLRLARFWCPNVGEVKAEQLGRPPAAILAAGSPNVRQTLEIHTGDFLQITSALKRVARGVVRCLPSWFGPLKPDDQSVLFASPQVLALLLADAKVIAPQGWKCQIYGNDDETGLDQAAIGRAFRDVFGYPTQWLTSPANEVKAQLDARSKLALYGFTGVFRAARGSGERYRKESRQGRASQAA